MKALIMDGVFMLLMKYYAVQFLVSVVIAFSVICLVPLMVLSTETGEKKTITPAQSLSPGELEEKWGIRPLSVRQTADGHMIDFRYRIIDAEKSSPLFHPTIKPIIIDENTGAIMAVPTVPKVGSMRSTRKPIKDRNYAILFANPHKHIKPGHKVTIVIGEYRAEHLVVGGGESAPPVTKSKEGIERKEELTDPGRTIKARKGQEFNIVLDSNQTTGYRWDLAGPMDGQTVGFVRNDYKVQESGKVGVGGKEIWTFAALQEGTAKIIMKYARPWEKDVGESKSVTFDVIVE